MMSSSSSCGENPSASHISSGCVVFVNSWELDGIKSCMSLLSQVVRDLGKPVKNIAGIFVEVTTPAKLKCNGNGV